MDNQSEDLMDKITQAQLDAMCELHAKYLSGRMGGRRAVLKNVDLSGLSLAGKDLRQADFTGCRLVRTNLSRTDFSESRVYACDLTESNLARCNFTRADLRGTRILGANLEQANLDKADLRVGGFSKNGMYDTGECVSFRGANLSGARLVGSLANNVDFSDSILAGANMSGADLRNAEMQGADLSGAQVTGAKLKGAHLKEAILTGVNMADISTMEVNINEAITDQNIGMPITDLEQPLAKLIEIHRVWVGSAGKEGIQLDLSGLDMRPLESLKNERLTAIRAVRTRFFSMNLNRLQLQSAVVDGSDFRRCDLDEADMRGTSLKGARFSHASVRNANFEPLVFGGGNGAKKYSPCDLEGASLTFADFSGCKMRMVNFKGADLSNTNFKGADLRECNFEDATMDGAILEGAHTEGAIFPSQLQDLHSL